MIMTDKYDVIIIGSGAAGLSAGLYSGRYRIKTLIISKEFGGETSLAGKIENYPGFKANDGFELMNIMQEQNKSVGTEFLEAEVKKIEKQGHCFVITTNSVTVEAKSIVFATGTRRKKLGLPNEKELIGRGVHYCITCDGPVYAGKTIVLVGGGDASVKGANLASEYTRKIFFLTREKEITAEPINIEQMKKIGDKIEILYETEVKEIIPADMGLEKLIISKPYNGSNEIQAQGLFIEIGAEPNVELAKSIGVGLDEKGYIKVDNAMKTNLDGVFAAGDITNYFGRFKQDIIAAAMGAVAATSAYDDIKLHGDLCPYHARPA